MERERALVVLKALADGIDPFTGELLPSASPYQHADAVRALVVAIDALRSMPSHGTAKSIDVSKPRRPVNPEMPQVGKPWTPEEEQRLRHAFSSRRSFDEIAREHGRTRGGITSRLIRMGLIHPESRAPIAAPGAGLIRPDERGTGSERSDTPTPL